VTSSNRHAGPHGSRLVSARAAFDRIVPSGAAILAVLSFGYFAMGILRNRVFANTFGAGADLDAYYAAFRLPEIALDVLVAAGLTAPFVPIYTSLRRDDESAANRFGRTVLTGAIGLMSIASVAIFALAPWIGDGSRASTARPDPSTSTWWINCFAQILFAASICIGEILVAHRQFLFYALAPILYTGGIVVGPISSPRLGIGPRPEAVAGAAPIWRAGLGTRRPFAFVRGRGPNPAFREFVR
jgi:putative peptidoglycan lipid II flippase